MEKEQRHRPSGHAAHSHSDRHHTTGHHADNQNDDSQGSHIGAPDGEPTYDKTEGSGTQTGVKSGK
ncbi:hypothetical protein [Silvimonas iriomotensis]|uniref:Uncharacterized protein n=1 Tax=Silvimonas iriomotensis TaxID=449662 RepID=A0ABQ2P6J4_9NEIS|nr:hypothetical protein [Silvimonas iriomotensis]GGP18891.1 hypothetical protein GCM10010970_07900 [Silvimonas iriomotensis]